MVTRMLKMRGTVNKKGSLIVFREFKFDDKKTGNLIEIERTTNYSILRINGRSYYFHPKTGKFDGVSSDVSQVS